MARYGNRFGITAFALAFGLAGGALAQQEPSGGSQDEGSQDEGTQQQDQQQQDQQQPKQQSGQQESRKDQGQGEQGSTVVPQYGIAESALFIQHAGESASVLSRERDLSIQDPQTLGRQAQSMVDDCQSALDGLNRLLDNADATNPEAVPPIRDAIAEVTAALSQARTVAEAAQNGELGPTYDVTVREVGDHLERASRIMKDVGRKDNAGDIGVSGRSLRFDTSSRSNRRP